MTTIVGDIYQGRCMYSGWDDTYGSVGRAAMAIARFGGKAKLRACVDSGTQETMEARATTGDLKFNGTPIQTRMTPEYIHGLTSPDIRHGTHIRSTLAVSGEEVLHSDMIDEIVMVSVDFTMYDPQNADEPESFSASDSIAKHLALVLNRHEASLLLPGSCGLRPKEIATVLARRENADVIAIKVELLDVLVHDNGKTSTVSAYRTERVWGIGSGNTLATHFALAWLNNGLSTHDTASIASITTALYCEYRGFPDQALLAAFKPEALQPPQRYRGGYIPKVYLTDSLFTLTELRMVGQARRDLKAMGLGVSSPYHDVGLGTVENAIEKGLEDVRNCNILFAIDDGLDSDVIFEINYTRALNKPAVFYMENKSEQDQKMTEGSDCTMTDDHISAICQMVWKAVEL